MLSSGEYVNFVEVTFSRFLKVLHVNWSEVAGGLTSYDFTVMGMV